jgi:hypothetical protein
MSAMRTVIILEADRAGKKYQFITPPETNVGEILDVASEFLDQAIKLIEEFDAKAKKAKEDAKSKLDVLITDQQMSEKEN